MQGHESQNETNGRGDQDMTVPVYHPNNGGVAGHLILDPEDVDRIRAYRWTIRGTANKGMDQVYARVMRDNGTYTPTDVGRVVTGDLVARGKMKHLNGNAFDARKSNLRFTPPNTEYRNGGLVPSSKPTASRGTRAPGRKFEVRAKRVTVERWTVFLNGDPVGEECFSEGEAYRELSRVAEKMAQGGDREDHY